jgi:hypothetical protein
MTAERPAAAEALLKAREQAASELKLPVTDARVVRLATMQLAYDSVQARLVTGQAFDLGDLLRLDAALLELRREVTPHEALKVDLQLYETPRGLFHCAACGARNELTEYEPAAPPTSRPPAAPKQTVVIDGEVVRPAPKAIAPPERPHPPGIHQHPGAACPPLDYSFIDPWP